MTLKTEAEQIKDKLRAFSERYDRKIREVEMLVESGKAQGWEKTFIAAKGTVRTEDDKFFKALFANELKQKGEKSP